MGIMPEQNVSPAPADLENPSYDDSVSEAKRDDRLQFWKGFAFGAVPAVVLTLLLLWGFGAFSRKEVSVKLSGTEGAQVTAGPGGVTLNAGGANMSIDQGQNRSSPASPSLPGGDAPGTDRGLFDGWFGKTPHSNPNYVAPGRPGPGRQSVQPHQRWKPSSTPYDADMSRKGKGWYDDYGRYHSYRG